MQISVKKFLEYIIFVLYLSIMLSGFNILQYGTTIRGIVLLAIMLLMVCMNYYKIVCFDSTQLFIFLFLIWVSSSLCWSADVNSSSVYIINYWYAFVIIFIVVPAEYLNRLLKVSERICFIYACSIFGAFIVGGNIFLNLFSWLLLIPQQVVKEFSEGVYSGFVGDKTQAAFVMNVGYGLKLAECFSKKKIEKKDAVYLIMYFLATLLTGKRTLSLVMVALTTVFFLFTDIRHKYIKSIGLLLTGGILLFLLVHIFPAFSVVFERFAMQSEAGDVLNGRADFWKCCKEMFRSRPVTGYGIASFNKVFSASYFEWNSFAHNIYYEMLAELGIVGVALFGIINVKVLVHGWKIYLKKACMQQQDVYFWSVGIYFITLVLIYGLTGNTMYNGNQLIWYILGVDLILITYYKLKKGD